ncbi:porin family protein [Chitinophaga arvensicola]|uniref:Outer membrane protein beta-barrel domain-containing protein n=1 Tax=Chitinophaga arvensicola TaxID=29529 RepID=A0A1I0RJ10_9BACT|nr:porin family protein [Chitinophaga arvensicola]SEW40953.1 Outer membrane protein beta-barrel domain-containing protein [Chitinophaga arvensicola]
MKYQSSFKWLLPALLLFCCTQANAQVDLGVRGGISIPNLTAGGSESNPLNTGYSSRQGPDFGIFGEYHLSKLFSIEAMISYSSQGGKKNGLQAFPPDPTKFPPGAPLPTYLYADFKSQAKLNYLMVPILAKFGWNLGPTSPLRLYVDAGPFFGFLVGAKQVTSGNSAIFLDEAGTQPAAPPESFDRTTDIKNQLNTFNFGVSGNVGLAYLFGRNQIFVEGGGNYGFLNIQKGTANGKNNTGAGTVSLGYAYRICNKK